MNLPDLRNRPPIHELSLAEVEKLISETRRNRVALPSKTTKAARTTSAKETDIDKFMKLASDLDPELLAKILGE